MLASENLIIPVKREKGRDGGRKELTISDSNSIASFEHHVKNTHTIQRWGRFEYGETLQIHTEIPVTCYWLKMTMDSPQGEQGYYLNRKKCKIFFRNSYILQGFGLVACFIFDRS